jgi:hypothetical protein
MKKQVVLGLCLLCSGAAFGMKNELFKKVKDNQWTWTTKDGSVTITNIDNFLYVMKRYKNTSIRLGLKKEDNGDWKKVFSGKDKLGDKCYYRLHPYKEERLLSLFYLFRNEHGSELNNNNKDKDLKK